MSASGFIRQMKGMGLSYRKSLMLSDWRTVGSIKAKENRMQFVRRDRLPSMKVMADVTWEYDKEYIYKLNTWSRLRPEHPLTERMVTLQSDVPLTPKEIEEQVAEKWPTFEKYKDELLERIRIVAGYHRIEGPLEE